jgi:hypothetical protein
MTTNPKFIGVYQSSVGPIIAEDNFSRDDTNRYVRRDVYQELVSRLNQYSIDHTNFAKENVKLQQKITELQSEIKQKGPQYALTIVDIFRVGEIYMIATPTTIGVTTDRTRYECVFASNTSAVLRDEKGNEILRKQGEASLWRKVIEKKQYVRYINFYDEEDTKGNFHKTAELAKLGSQNLLKQDMASARIKVVITEGQFDD